MLKNRAGNGCVDKGSKTVTFGFSSGDNFIEMRLITKTGRGTGSIGEKMPGKSIGEQFRLFEVNLFPIIDVLERGYKLGDKVIRFPKVVIGQ